MTNGIERSVTPVPRHHAWVTVWARRGVLIAGGVIGAAADARPRTGTS
jgi:hypothetical protein